MAGSQTDTSVRTHRLQSYPAEPEEGRLSDCMYSPQERTASPSQRWLRKPHGRRPRPIQHHPPCRLPFPGTLSVPQACRPQKTILGSRHGHTTSGLSWGTAQSPKAWSWPPAGFPPAPRRVQGENGNTGGRAACLPSPRPHIGKSLARSPRKHLSRVPSPGCRLEPPPASRPRFYCLGTAQEQVF